VLGEIGSDLGWDVEKGAIKDVRKIKREALYRLN
jgi:hypothetical protein